LKTIRTNFDRDEARRDRRYPLPLIRVMLAGADFETGNWSLGGFMLASQPDRAAPDLAVGATVAGQIQPLADRDPLDFTAEVVRRDADGTGFRFTDISMELVGALDRALANRMFRKRA
jgi:hypothetical protein